MRRALLLAAGLAACAGTAAAQQRAPAPPSGAGAVTFIVAPKNSFSREVAIAVNPEVKDVDFDVAQYDLNADGRAEILIKLKGDKDCDVHDKARCRVVVMQETPQGWGKLLDRRAAQVTVGNIGFGGFRSLSLDGREGFVYNGKTYRIDLAQTGRPLTFSDAPAQAKALLIAQFGDGARRLKDVSVKVASASLAEGKTLVFARLEGPGACGAAFGCPWRLLQPKDGSYTVVSQGMGGPDASILGVVRGGWRDLAVKQPNGYAVYGWAGERYVLAERINEEGRR